MHQMSPKFQNYIKPSMEKKKNVGLKITPLSTDEFFNSCAV